MYYSRQPHHRNVKSVLVYLAEDEWGNRKMDEVARETFAQYPDAECVEVREHAGWYLTYNRKMQIVGTANDACTVTPTMKAFWRDVWAVDYLAIIRRQSTAQSEPVQPAVVLPAVAMPGMEA